MDIVGMDARKHFSTSDAARISFSCNIDGDWDQTSQAVFVAET